MTKSDTSELQGYEVVVGVCGGIAAYKVCQVVSSLVQRGVGVTVVMTEAATHFVGPTTFGALSSRPVLTSMWSGSAATDPQHIRVTQSADLFLIAPATANMIGKMAAGICDDLVSTMVAAASGPVMLAPAMNDVMWQHRPVQDNVVKLVEWGYVMVGPEEGWLACRSVGPGRMADPETIVQRVCEKLRSSPSRRGRSERG